MRNNLIAIVLMTSALFAVAQEKEKSSVPRVRGLGLDMTLGEVKKTVGKIGLKIGPDEGSAMRTATPFFSEPGRSEPVKAVKSYEIYAEGETIQTEQTSGLFEPVQGLNTPAQMRQVTMKDPRGYVLVDEGNKVVGLSLAFAIMDAKGEPTEKVVQTFEKKFGIKFSRTRILLNDGRTDIKYLCADKNKGFEIEFTDLMFDKFVDIRKTRSDKRAIKLD
jgi:hypothetical protein